MKRPAEHPGWIQDTFKTWDGLNLHYRVFSPEAPRASMILVHGHGEHGGRYEHFATYLKDANIRLAIMDSRGMGQSEGEAAYVEDFEDYLKDISEFHLHLQHSHGYEPQTLLFGHSLGGLEALAWADKNADSVRGLILSSPCFQPRVPLVARILNQLVHGLFPHFVYTNPVSPRNLTHDPEVFERYKKDPLILKKISARLFHVMLEEGEKLKRIRGLSLNFSIFGLLAGDDRIVDNAITRDVFKKITAPKKGIETLPGYFHETFQETGRGEAFRILMSFIDRILGP